MSEWIDINILKPRHQQQVDIWVSLSSGYDQGDEGRITDMVLNRLSSEFWRLSEIDGEVETIHISQVTHWMHLPEPPTKKPSQ